MRPFDRCCRLLTFPPRGVGVRAIVFLCRLRVLPVAYKRFCRSSQSFPGALRIAEYTRTKKLPSPYSAKP